MDLIDDLLPGLFGHVGGGLGPHRQNDRLLRLHTPLGPDVLLAERARIDEQVGPTAASEPPAGEHPTNDCPAGLRLEIDALASDTHLELKSLLGQPVLLQLLTAHSRTDLRPWHGHVTRASLLGSDGGLARYRLVVEPWLAMLAHRRDSWVFQGASVMEIIEQVFGDHEAQGTLAPSWRWDLADPSAYPQRSLCIQYQESDLDFVHRLMREEGLVCWWEHEGDTSSAALGRHTLVIADHNAAVSANTQPRVRYTQSHAALREDSLVRWSRQRRVRTGGLTLASRDYRTLGLREQAADTAEATPPTQPLLQLHDVPGGYAYEDAAQGQRLARVQMQAIDALREQVHARGAWRTAQAGTRFTLLDHPVHDGSVPGRDEFIITAVTHRVRSNLAADDRARLAAADATPRLPHEAIGQLANAGDEPVHVCELQAQPARLALRRPNLDERGLPDARLHPRPTVTGTQTALVVGLGEPLHTDRDHRIKVQFHWQRGSRASHRLDAAGGDNAPASDASGTWVRVGEAVAGANWGSVFTPRLGQEVLVQFEAGDIDRPLVVGVVYNGQGAENAQGNQVSAGAAGAVGSASPWFPGTRHEGPLEAHQHTQVHAGYKSQELATSQGGFGGHNHLVADDTPGQGRLELYSSSAQARLQLGHLLHQVDNRRLQHRGHGADLATQAWGAVRAGAGQLISAHRQAASVQAGQHIASREPINQVDLARQLVHVLAESAQHHHAKTLAEPDIIGAKRPDTARQLPAEQGLCATLDSLETTDTRGGAEGDEENTGGGTGTVTAWGRPDLVTAAPAGIGSFTPASTLFTAGSTLTLAAGQDLQQIAQAHHATAVKDAAILYTYGRAQDPKKPNQETGIRLHAASGNVQTQSQTGATKVAADQRIQVVSTTGKVTIAAPKHVLFWAAGAAIRLQGGAVSNTGPGSVLYQASLKIFNSPGGVVSYAFRQLPRPEPMKPTDLEFRRIYPDNSPIPGLRFEVTFGDGTKRKGATDATGLARLAGVPPGPALVVYELDRNKPEASVQLDVDEDFQRLFGQHGGAA